MSGVGIGLGVSGGAGGGGSSGAALAAHIADTSDAHDASAISFAPAGTVAATDVQAAIEEVASEAATNLSNHISDATDAHAGTAITNTPAGTIAATTVQAAINELDGDVQAHIGDTTDAHDASAISVVPTGNLAADDVQEALVELQTDIDGFSGSSHAALTLTAFGSSPAAEGASLSTQALTLQPADATRPGGISLSAQVMGDGDKSFSDAVAVGTTSAPNTRLQVAGHTGANGVNISVDAGTSTASGRLFFSNTTGGQSTVIHNASGAMLFSTAGTVGSSSGTERMRIATTGNVGIGGSPDALAILDLVSTTKGFRAPSMDTTARDAIVSPPTGLSIFNTTTARPEYYDGTVWQAGDGSIVVFNSAESLSAAGTITASRHRRQRRRVAGNGGAITVSATTAVTAGVYDGQEVTIVGTDDANTVTIDNTGNVKLNGSITLGLDDAISLMWDANDSNWMELYRSE